MPNRLAMSDDIRRSAGQPARLTVACLCAEWCHICNDYRAVFDELAASFDEPIQFVWVDIEEHEDLLGSLEVENFPTLMIGNAGALMFCGPVIQKSEHAKQLIRKGLVSELGSVDEPALVEVLSAVSEL